VAHRPQGLVIPSSRRAPALRPGPWDRPPWPADRLSLKVNRPRGRGRFAAAPLPVPGPQAAPQLRVGLPPDGHGFCDLAQGMAAWVRSERDVYSASCLSRKLGQTWT